MACPPEDCGGIGGFYQKLELVSTPPGDDEDPEAAKMKKQQEKIQQADRGLLENFRKILKSDDGA